MIRSEKYEVKAISNSKVYAKELDRNHLLSLYYLVLLEDYLEEKNT